MYFLKQNASALAPLNHSDKSGSLVFVQSNFSLAAILQILSYVSEYQITGGTGPKQPLKGRVL